MLRLLVPASSGAHIKNVFYSFISILLNVCFFLTGVRQTHWNKPTQNTALLLDCYGTSLLAREQRVKLSPQRQGREGCGGIKKLLGLLLFV